MSRVGVIEAFDEMITTMTTARGYYFDWVDEYDRSRGDSGKASLDIHVGDETNKDDEGGCGSNQYIDECIVTMKVKVPVSTVTRKLSDGQEMTFAKALDDVKKRFGSDKYFRDKGIPTRNLKYLSSVPEKEEKEGVVTPSRLVCEFRLKYITNRGIGEA